MGLDSGVICLTFYWYCRRKKKNHTFVICADLPVPYVYVLWYVLFHAHGLLTRNDLCLFHDLVHADTHSWREVKN